MPLLIKPKKQIMKTPMDFLSHTPAEIEVEEEFINQETLPNQFNRFDTLGFICIENVPDEQNTDESVAEKLQIKSYHFAPRSYNIKPKKMTKLNEKSDEHETSLWVHQKSAVLFFSSSKGRVLDCHLLLLLGVLGKR